MPVFVEPEYVLELSGDGRYRRFIGTIQAQNGSEQQHGFEPRTTARHSTARAPIWRLVPRIALLNVVIDPPDHP